MHYFYLLQSIEKSNKIYTGSTNDLKSRFSEHNQGKVFSTKRYLPWRLIYYEAYLSERDARLREQKFKRHGKGNQELKKRLENSLKIFKKGEGFTLVELLLYVGITSILLIAISVFTITLLKSRIKNQTIAEVEQQGVMVMQIITQTIRNAELINLPTIGSNSSSLSIDVVNTSYDPTIFDLSADTLRITQGSFGAVTLTNSRVTASGLIFYNLSRAATPGIIRIQFTLTHNNPSGRNEYDYQKTFITSASLRQP